MALIPVSSIGNKALAKVTIIPFDGPKSLKPSGIPFVAMYNPAGFSTQKGQILIEKPDSSNITSTVDAKNQINESVTLDLFLDATGASLPGGVIGKGLALAAKNAQGVDLLIANFFATTLELNADTHTSRYLRVIWGAGLFMECQLQNASVKYDLIGTDGRPLRATISATFLQNPSASAISKFKNLFASPDLTKVHTVKAGDTIYNIAKNEYDDESYYLQIAEANNLKNYRRLQPGSTLILPPIKKDE